MPVFEYKGLDVLGKGVSGIVDADNPRMARQRLKKDGIYPTDLTEGEEKDPTQGARISARRVKGAELAIFTRQLATLVGAGLPMMECLNALVEQVDNPRLKNVVADVRERVKEGSPLSEALTHHPKLFSELYVGMVAAGESSGTLDTMLMRLAEFTERQMALQGTVVGAMVYPAFTVGFSLLILGLLLAYVVPKVTRVFEGMGQALPTPTVILLTISDGVRDYWWLLFLLAFLLWQWGRRWVATETGRLRYDQFTLSIPVVGRLVRMVAISRFTRTLSTLLAGGIPLLEAMEITRRVVINRVLADAIGSAGENIREGENIAVPLAESGVFPPMVTHMISVGEATGELEDMLVKVAEAYDREVETTVASLTSLLTPVMIVLMGGVVLAIVMAILLPIVEMSGVVG